MTCPVGGEQFQGIVTTHYSTWGSRPDGKPYGSWVFPMPMPSCPSNGLALFETFDAATVEKLKPLVASREYQKLVREDSTYYRAQWLTTKLGLSEIDALWLLLPATWQVKPALSPTGDPLVSEAKAKAYQEEFVRRVRALPVAPDDKEYVALHARAANALRELGRFGEARKMLRSVSAWAEAKKYEDWTRYAAALGKVIARKDKSTEPLDMVPDTTAEWRCADEKLEKTSFNSAFCAQPKLQARVSEIRAMREKNAAR